MERWKTVMRLKVHVGLFAGFLLLVHLHLLLAPDVAPRWFSCALLAHAGHMSYVSITGLGVLLRCLAGWPRFFWMTAFLASYVFGARGTLLGWMPTACTFLWHCGRRGQPGAFLKVLLHLLTWWGYSTKAGPTCKMCTDNVVEVGQIILDGVHAEWATWHTWLVPVLSFFRLVNSNASKCTLRM